MYDLQGFVDGCVACAAKQAGLLDAARATGRGIAHVGQALGNAHPMPAEGAMAHPAARALFTLGDKAWFLAPLLASMMGQGHLAAHPAVSAAANTQWVQDVQRARGATPGVAASTHKPVATQGPPTRAPKTLAPAQARPSAPMPRRIGGRIVLAASQSIRPEMLRALKPAPGPHEPLNPEDRSLVLGWAQGHYDVLQHKGELPEGTTPARWGKYMADYITKLHPGTRDRVLAVLRNGSAR